ncbi:hypothetical protein Dimus_019044 [Dionaea muscipula]
MGGRGSLSTDDETDDGEHGGSTRGLGSRQSDPGSTSQQLNHISDGNVNEQEVRSQADRAMGELEQPLIMIVRSGQNEEVARDCINNIINSEGIEALRTGPRIGTREGSSTREEKEISLHGTKSVGPVSIGFIDPSRNNFCLPVSNLLGPDYQADKVNLEVVMNIGEVFTSTNGLVGVDASIAKVESSFPHLDLVHGAQTTGGYNPLLSMTSVQDIHVTGRREVEADVRISSHTNMDLALNGLAVKAQTGVSQGHSVHEAQAKRNGASVGSNGGGSVRRRGRPGKKKDLVSQGVESFGCFMLAMGFRLILVGLSVCVLEGLSVNVTDPLCILYGCLPRSIQLEAVVLIAYFKPSDQLSTA